MKFEEKIVHSIISTAVNIHHNEQLQYSPLYDKEIKKYGNLYLNHILKKEKYFDGFLEQQEASAVSVHDTFFDYTSEVAKVTIPEMGEVINLIRAYKKDKKSLNGIVNKILK